MIGILEKDKTAVRKFSRGDAIRKCAFIVSVGGTLPTSDIDDAERTSGKVVTVHATQPSIASNIRNIPIMAIPPRITDREILS